MPLAPAHPAVVLPFRRLGLPLSALVAGAVAPDAPVYLPLPVEYATTHSGPGIVADVVIALALLALWDQMVRDAVVDLLPTLRRRSDERVRLDRRSWLLAPVAVTVGAASHVLWDSVTHDWGFVVEHLDVLRDSHGGLPLYGWLQHLSTVVGAVVVAAYGVHLLRLRPRRPRPAAVRRPELRVAPLPLVALVAGVALGPEAAVGATLLALLAVALAWTMGSRGAPRREGNGKRPTTERPTTERPPNERPR